MAKAGRLFPIRVLHFPSGNHPPQPVLAIRKAPARIMNSVGIVCGGHAPRRKIPAAQRAERLRVPL